MAKTKKKAKTHSSRVTRTTRPAVPAPTMPASRATANISPAPTPAPKPSRMTRARLLSPAAKRGADLVRYLKIHAKHPYGPRGQEAIVKIAREAGHLASLELAAAARDRRDAGSVFSRSAECKEGVMKP
jgi:hypothetical protein